MKLAIVTDAWQPQVNGVVTTLSRTRDALARAGHHVTVLSPEALEKKRQDLVKRGRDRQGFLEDGQQELQRMQERAQQQAQTLNGEFQVKIKPYVDALAREMRGAAERRAGGRDDLRLTGEPRFG